MIPESRRIALAIVLLLACRDDELPIMSAGAGSSEAMPSLHLQRTSTSIDDSPSGLTTQFIVSPGGIIVMNIPESQAHRYTILDTSGAVAHLAGRVGDGPGEVRGGKLVMLDSGFVVASDRLVQFNFSGEPVATRALSYRSNPGAYAPPGLLLDYPIQEGGPRIGFTSLDGGGFRRVIPPSDTFLANSFGFPLRPDGGTRNPTLGLWANGVLIGDGWTYRLGLYDWDGQFVRMIRRDIPHPRPSAASLERRVNETVRSLRSMGRRIDDARIARMRQEEIEREERHFGFHRPTGLDSLNRIWVLGVEGDSAFADVFSSERFLGRLAIPCTAFSHSWALAGRWLVMACAPDDPESALDAAFKVFRIEG